MGILDGVTTNPSLMAKEGIKGEEAIAQHYKLHRIAGHEHVAPDRKQDPGAGFDWVLLRQSLGWPKNNFPQKN